MYLKKALSQHLFQSRMKHKILCAPRHRDKKLGKLQLPFLTEKAQSHFRVCVLRYTDILVKEKTKEKRML